MSIQEKGRGHLVEFEVKQEFLETLRSIAQPEHGVLRDRTLPWKVDVDYPDQYANPPAMLDELEAAIVPVSGKSHFAATMTRIGSMLQEEKNVEVSRPSERPPGFGYSVVLRTDDPAEFLLRFRATWRVVSSWGRFCDDEAGEWPTNHECLARLPTDFALSVRTSRVIDMEGWLEDLHDRDWVVWSLARLGDQVKIDIAANSMPISTSTIRLVSEVLGAEIVYADSWRP